MNIKALALVMTGLFGLGLAAAWADDNVDHGFVDRVYKNPDGEESKYVLFVPYDYEGDKPYPLLVSLHGDGEKGTDGKKPSQKGLVSAVHKQEKAFLF